MYKKVGSGEKSKRCEVYFIIVDFQRRLTERVKRSAQPYQTSHVGSKGTLGSWIAHPQRRPLFAPLRDANKARVGESAAKQDVQASS